MPLSCDCYGGCWAHHSENWFKVIITEDDLEKNYALKLKESGYRPDSWEAIVYVKRDRYPAHALSYKLLKGFNMPYGTYVSVGNEMRFETQELANKFSSALEKFRQEGS